jgi:hypothetical protein
MYLEALAHHTPVFSSEGVSCSCGEWKTKRYNQSSYDSHIAKFLAQLYQPPKVDENGIEMLRHFYLERGEDVSGSSGIGRVAEGFVYEDGHVAVRWLVAPFSFALYESVEDVKEIHGHQGQTRLVPAIDEQPMTMDRRRAQSRSKR